MLKYFIVPLFLFQSSSFAFESFSDLNLRHHKLYDVLSNLKNNSAINQLLEVMESDKKDLEIFGNLAENPLTILKFTKRFAIDLENLQEFPALKVFELDQNEFNNALEALERLQFTFDLKTEDLVKGIVDGVKCSKALSSSDLLAVANELIYLGKDFRAAEYLRNGLESAKTSDSIAITKKLLRVLKRLKKFHEAFELCSKIVKDLEEYPEPSDSTGLNFFRKELKNFINLNLEDSSSKKVYQDFSTDPEVLIIAKACRGEIVKKSSELSRLHCYFESTNSFTKLSRFKIEVMSENPFLVVFHDVVSEIEIEVLKNISQSKFTRAVTVSSEGDATAKSTRISQVAWHADKAHSVVSQISTRIEDMTKLSTETAEKLQVQLYGVGGHYAAHYDFATDYETPFQYGTGNRIATVLFYVSQLVFEVFKFVILVFH